MSAQLSKYIICQCLPANTEPFCISYWCKDSPMLLQGSLDKSTSAQGTQDQTEQPKAQARPTNNFSALPAISQLQASRRLSISPTKPHSSKSYSAREQKNFACPSVPEGSQRGSDFPPQNNVSTNHAAASGRHHIGGPDQQPASRPQVLPVGRVSGNSRPLVSFCHGAIRLNEGQS